MTLNAAGFNNTWILGLTFFQNYYTVFDQEDLQIGFAISRFAHPKVMDFHKNTTMYDSVRMTLSEADEQGT